MVATLLERRLEATNELELIEYYADLDDALEVLGWEYPRAKELALRYAQGYYHSTWADEHHNTVQQALEAVFAALALIMNGEA